MLRSVPLRFRNLIPVLGAGVLLASCTASHRAAIAHHAPAPTVGVPAAAPCRSQDLRIAATWEAGATIIRATSPRDRTAAANLIGVVRVSNVGAPCLLTRQPGLRLLGQNGAVLPVPTKAAGYCRFSCQVHLPILLHARQMSVVGFIWEPSYCGPWPGKTPRLVVTVQGVTQRVPVRRTDADSRTSAPSCVREQTSRPAGLIVEGYGPSTASGRVTTPHA